ncbi:MAG: DUF3800 domain-containing protein [Actinobacteria bacterium]|nr:DUF3800 domain-containing protein [Actinomycetota bacterium]
MPEDKEFIFVDESGDPGPDGNPIYILIAMHVGLAALDDTRRHLAAFRYHHDVVKEFKDQRWAEKLSPASRHLLVFLAEATDAGEIASTGIWLRKGRYRNGGGPYFGEQGDAVRFRHFQLRLLLERHIGRRQWGQNLDLVIDRWRMNLEQRRNLEDYLRGNFKLRPMIGSITTVDSAYADPIQVVDIYARLIRRVLVERASDEEATLAGRLVDLTEIKGGLFA